tara:strand:+ start:1788 stop:2405 length:618 start_codon:yes stop_codon:yes gene_type:complete
METKRCSKCGETKGVGEFHKDRGKKDGLFSYCKPCVKKYNVLLRPRYEASVTEKTCNTCGVTKGAGEFSKDRTRRSGLRGVCRDCDQKARAQHQKDNPDIDNAKAAKRRAAKIMRTAPWASQEAIGAVYTEASRLTRETGVSHHVDHSVPLQGVLVSGLHLPCNLQVMEGGENIGKGNRWNPWTGLPEAPCPQAVIELTRNLEDK